MGIQFLATGSYLPGDVVTNDDLAKFLDTSDEWITSRTGIKTRHIAKGETTSDLAVEAARAALSKSGISSQQIGLVICASVSPDVSVPMIAAKVKRALGIENAAAFDLNANCSSFVYTTTTAYSLMQTCGYEYALIVGADTNSQIVDWTDRATCVLFGDGAGAAVLARTDAPGILATHLDCIIDHEDALNCANKLNKTPFFDPDVDESLQSRPNRIQMKGSKVMKFAIRAFTESAKIVAQKAGVQIADIKAIVPHQANLRILSSAAKSLGVPLERFYVNIDRVANTSAASVPTALDEAVQNGVIKRGDLVLLAAFGGGLSSGAVLLEW